MSKKIISNIFNYAVQEGAKDLIIESNPKKVNISYLFSGGEERSFDLPKKLENDLGSSLRQVLKLAPEDLVAKKYCKIRNKSGHFNFYLTIISSSTGEKMIINISPRENRLLRLKQLGMQRQEIKTMQTALRRRSGLILISSPLDQGKSTTLYAVLKELNTENRSLYFLGDDPEYHFDNINCLANTRNNWDKLLCLDSDIIVTDITKESDLKKSLTAAATGRLVISTINANSVWEVLLAILKVKLPLKLKLDCLSLITNQRVVPLKRNNLKKTYKKTSRRKNIGIFEILTLIPKIKKYILEKEDTEMKKSFWENLNHLALKNGHEPLSYDQKKKIKNGLI